MNFSRGNGGLCYTSGNSREVEGGGRGGGGSSLPYNSGKFREVGGSYVKFPLWWASGYFLKPHIFSSKGFFVVS